MIKGQHSKTHGIEYNAQIPCIDFDGVIRIARKHLRSCVAGTTAGCDELFSSTVDITQPKVDDFHVVFIVEEDVLRLEVAMHHS
jgi:hypothetical protein